MIGDIPSAFGAVLAKGSLTTAEFDALEKQMLDHPAALPAVPVTHSFANGQYIREGTLPAGSLVMGHAHTAPHQFNLKTGSLTLYTPGQPPRRVTAPASFVSPPGRKLVQVHEDATIQNVHSTDNWPAHRVGNVAATENHIYAPSPAWRAKNGK